MSRLIRRRLDLLILLGLLLLTACSKNIESGEGEITSPTAIESSNLLETGEDIATTIAPSFTNVRIQDDNDYNFPFLIPFDGIPPVYDPIFLSAEDSPLINEELIIGIAWGGESKAYPISVLRFREMVNDELAGIPTLVTW